MTFSKRAPEKHYFSSIRLTFLELLLSQGSLLDNIYSGRILDIILMVGYYFIENYIVVGY